MLPALLLALWKLGDPLHFALVGKGVTPALQVLAHSAAARHSGAVQSQDCIHGTHAYTAPPSAASEKHVSGHWPGPFAAASFTNLSLCMRSNVC